MSAEEQHNYEAKLDAVCWGLCGQSYVERDNPVFPEDCVFKLFRIFCMLGDMVENERGQVEVRHDALLYDAHLIRPSPLSV
jgi:hypothetical protein